MRWKLGRAFGINIFVHWTFLLLVGYVLFASRGAGEGTQLDRAILALSLLGGAFGCVVLHELGHALMARRFGIPTRDITLYPIGGVARLERMSERPWEEFWIAVAGPAVNVVIAIILLLATTFSLKASLADGISLPEFLAGNLLFELLRINLLLVLFNMLPAFPMDGGRVLRAVLSHFLGRLRATEIAAQLGVLFAVIFALVGFGLIHIWPLSPAKGASETEYQPFLVLIGVFVLLAGQQELAMVRYQERQRKAPPLDVLPAGTHVVDAVPVDPGEHSSGPVWDSRAGAWVVWRDGQPGHRYWMD
jgi:Zn-dependent protease